VIQWEFNRCHLSQKQKLEALRTKLSEEGKTGQWNGVLNVMGNPLTRKDIAVLRYDDRGTAESTDDYSAATFEVFTRDALHAVAYLKGRNEVDQGYVGLIGHSEGGVMAPMTANRDNAGIRKY
jgi:dienelactone hydrolase